MKISKQQMFDVAVLLLRWYLAVYMFDYGWGKLKGEQFGLHDPALANQPLKDLDLFHVAWYLFAHPTFRWATGLGEILGAVLIAFNRTAIIGALFLLPLIFTVWLIDVCFTMHLFGMGLVLRLSLMLAADVVILIYHKEKMVQVWRWLTAPDVIRFHYPWWVYLLLPIAGFLMDLVLAVLSAPFKILYSLF